jgi:carboxypeptidase T
MRFRFFLSRKLFSVVAISALIITFASQKLQSESPDQYWMKIRAEDKFKRTWLGELGIPVEIVRDEYVYAIGNKEQKELLERKGWLEVSYPTQQPMDFPSEDSKYHNFEELTLELQELSDLYPKLITMGSIGTSVEGRQIWIVRLGSKPAQADNFPGSIFMGGHHAREHLSVEMPLLLIRYLAEEYTKGNTRIVNMLDSRDIHIIPVVNPDGMEYDIKDANYKYWRKNRAKNKDGSYGVDLNRNYGFQWGTGGSSKSPGSDTYMGPKPFSEPETQAIKSYIENHKNITTLLTFHTFSELILYPWGHKDAGIENARAKAVHETMARKMAQWNKYKPQQSSELYIASGDTTDWSFGQLGIISFTFELDPSSSMGGGGFYPGDDVIPSVFAKNLEPALYLIDYSDNPYRVIDSSKTGLSF